MRSRSSASRGAVLVLAITAAAAWCGAQGDSSAPVSPATPPVPAEVNTAGLPDGLYATFSTARGGFVAELHPQFAPLAVANFVGLAEGSLAFEGRPAGQPFYDGLVFHRVVDGFVVQGGDPLGSGEGGPGYEFADEFSPRAKHDAAGVLAMANAGPNTNGSQFYFTLNPVNRLNYKHTVFGRVVRGLEVLPRIRQGDAMLAVRIVRIGDSATAFRPDAASFQRLRETAPVIPARHAALPALFLDDAKLDLPEFYPAWLNDKLHHFEAVRGVTVYVRTLPRLQGADTPDGAQHALAATHEQLAGREPRSATLIYSAEEKLWRLWLGDGLFGILGASPDRIADVKQRILSGAARQVAEGVARRSIDAAVTDLIEAIDSGEFPAR